MKQILSGFIMMLCLGTVYAYSVFRVPLEAELGIGSTLSGLPYMVALMSYALCMMLTGRVINRYGPRKIIYFGTLWVSLGWLLSGLGTNIWHFTLTYGVLLGSGVGIIYGVPMATAAKWFPHKRGLAVGSVLLGFGLSPLVTAPLARLVIGSLGLKPAFMVFGLAFAGLLTLLGSFITYPKDQAQSRVRPASGPLVHQGLEGQLQPLSPALKRPLVYLYTTFFLGTLVGLTLIGKTTSLGLRITTLNAGQIALWISVFAVFNGMGRPVFGWLTDRYSPRVAMALAYLLVVIASAILLVPGLGGPWTFGVSFSLYWMSLGAWLAIAPATTLRVVGQDHYGRVYGTIFTAYGLGAVLGTALSGILLDLVKDYRLVIGALMAAASLGLVLVIAKGRKLDHYGI